MKNSKQSSSRESKKCKLSRDGTSSSGSRYQVLAHLENERTVASPVTSVVTFTENSSHDFVSPAKSRRDVFNGVIREANQVYTKLHSLAMALWMQIVERRIQRLKEINPPKMSPTSPKAGYEETTSEVPVSGSVEVDLEVENNLGAEGDFDASQDSKDNEDSRESKDLDVADFEAVVPVKAEKQGNLTLATPNLIPQESEDAHKVFEKKLHPSFDAQNCLFVEQKLVPGYVMDFPQLSMEGKENTVDPMRQDARNRTWAKIVALNSGEATASAAQSKSAGTFCLEQRRPRSGVPITTNFSQPGIKLDLVDTDTCTDFIDIEDELVDKESWMNCAVGYFLGDEMLFGQVRATARTLWGRQEIMVASTSRDFSTWDICEMSNGVWSLPYIISELKMNRRFSSMATWVRCFGLPWYPVSFQCCKSMPCLVRLWFSRGSLLQRVYLDFLCQ
ncbi:hypothetical protein U1Q18_040493 [Sarracenia purpurea var. burkii]